MELFVAYCQGCDLGIAGKSPDKVEIAGQDHIVKMIASGATKGHQIGLYSMEIPENTALMPSRRGKIG